MKAEKVKAEINIEDLIESIDYNDDSEGRQKSIDKMANIEASDELKMKIAHSEMRSVWKSMMREFEQNLKEIVHETLSRGDKRDIVKTINKKVDMMRHQSYRVIEEVEKISVARTAGGGE